MANPQIPQGTLNRLLASVIVPADPSLNVTPSFLAPEMINIALEGQAVTNLPSATGIVPSSEPYMMARVTIHVLRTTPLADLWKTRKEFDALIGNITVRPDTKILSPYEIENASIINVEAMSFNGRQPDFTISLQGVYRINANLWV